MLWGERRGQCHHRRSSESTERPMPQLNDLSRSLAILEQDATLIAGIEMGQSSWLVAGIVPGVERSPLKKLAVDESALLKLLHRWREEAEQAGHRIKRIAVAFEAGRDGFWLARWLRARGIEAHVIHASSVAVSREHRRAKTDRLDTELLKRAFLGWLRGERDHCKMVAIPTLAQEDAKRPNRERESLVGEQSRIVNRMKAALARLGIRGFRARSGIFWSIHSVCCCTPSSMPPTFRTAMAACCCSPRCLASFHSSLVLRTNEKCATDPQDNDCGAGTQAADRPVAARAGGRDPGGGRPATNLMSGVA